MMAERTQREKHHSYDLRLKLRAVRSSSQKEFEVDKTINARFK